jgi:hypothetical protein
MNWYAVRTVPGSQKPQREYAVETTALGKDGRPKGKGYRIVPSLNPNMSAIERALKDSGFSYYMPAEKRLVRDRRKTDLFKTRRFALMVGYVFVRDPHSFYALQQVPGVAGIVGVDGNPAPIPLLDILELRGMEAEVEVEFDDQVRKARWQLRKKAKRDDKLRRLVESLDAAGTFTVPLDSDVLAA